MALNKEDIINIVNGFSSRFQMRERQTQLTNPIKLQITVNGKKQTFRLWCFEITHGGGGPLVRAANEYRVQITRGPLSVDEFDNGATEILLGYARDKNVIVAYDRRWLMHFTEKKQEDPTSRPSPSVQVKTEQIDEGKFKGIFAFKKGTRSFGKADIICMTPENLPEFLANYNNYLQQF